MFVHRVMQRVFQPGMHNVLIYLSISQGSIRVLLFSFLRSAKFGWWGWDGPQPRRDSSFMLSIVLAFVSCQGKTNPASRSKTWHLKDDPLIDNLPQEFNRESRYWVGVTIISALRPLRDLSGVLKPSEAVEIIFAQFWPRQILMIVFNTIFEKASGLLACLNVCVWKKKKLECEQ